MPCGDSLTVNTRVQITSRVIKVSGHYDTNKNYAAHTVNLHLADGHIATISGEDSQACHRMGFGDGQPFEFDVPPGAYLREINTDCHGKITGIKTSQNGT